MTLPRADQVLELARQCVFEAAANDTLHNLTPKLLRREVEGRLKLNEGELDASEYRNAVKKAIATAMEDIKAGKIKEEENADKKPDSSKKALAKGKKRTSDTGADGDSKKKPRVNKKQKGKVAERETPPVHHGQPSPEHIDTCEVSVDPGSFERPKWQPSLKVAKDKPTSTKRRKSAPTRVADSGDEASGMEVDLELSMGQSHGDTPIPDPPASTKDAGEKTGHQSESELSVLIDESPKRKRKAKSEKDNVTVKKATVKGGTRGRKVKSETLSKDEETIKRLKSFVVACGVRKVWSKVFQGLDSPIQQINKLKEILSELGMSGRMSMEQAKAIREKREFEQELQDVQEFQKAVLKSGSRRGAAKEQDDGSTSDPGESEEDGNPQPRRRKMNAAQSINAFLGDQSSDDD